ncbi:MAG TPA: hypothetical protein VFA56_04530 [Gaiellaceae bacterium]|nr:hypothetical protein [Gaiellaceae bacterium]
MASEIKIPRRAARFGEIAQNVIVQLAYPVVSDLIDRSRKQLSFDDQVQLQIELAKHALEARDLDRTLRDALDNAHDRRRDALGADDRDAIATAARSIDVINLDLEANKRRRYALRVVQDGIIWRTLGYDRLTIGTLGHGDPVNYLSNDFDAEAEQAEIHWNEGRLALFGDLSNIMRTGDLLVRDPSNGKVMLHEVKAGRSRNLSQQQRIQEKIDYLNTGRSTALADDAPVHAPVSSPRLRTYLANAVPLFRRAREHGFDCGQLGPGVAAFMSDGRGLGDADLPEHERRIISGETRLMTRLAWNPLETYTYNSLERIDRDRTNAWATTAPYSIFPLDAETCAALCLGWAGYRTTINLAIFKAAIERRGFQVAVDVDKSGRVDLRDALFWVGRPDGRLRVPPRLADQILIEFVTPAALADNVQASFDQLMSTDGDKLHISVRWADEGRIWS